MNCRKAGRLVASTLALLSLGAGTAHGEDPSIQREMAKAYGEKLGVEDGVARARLDRQDKLMAVADRLRSAAGDGYGGAWFDDRGIGRMRVGVASDARGVAARVAEAAHAAGVADDVEIVSVRSTLAELATAQEALDRLVLPAIETGDVVTSIDAATNSVIVRVAAGASSDLRAQLEAAVRRLAVEARLEAAPAESLALSAGACVTRTSDNSMFCGNPFRGGPLIGGGGTGCTPGFVVIGNSGGNPWVLTAGHCLVNSGSATWASRDTSLTLHDLGSRHSWTFGGGGDYGILGMSTAYWNTSPYVVYNGATTYNETYRIYGPGTSSQGMAICGTSSQLLSNGRYTDCGSVVALNITASVGGTVVQGLGKSNVCTGRQGASGGPYYKNGTAYGLFSAYASNCETYYQGVNAALSGSNVHLPG